MIIIMACLNAPTICCNNVVVLTLSLEIS